jgi:hypothetical protein
VTAAPVPDQVRLAELLGVLSLGADLGLDQSMEHALRQCVIARRMGEHIGLADADLDAMYYLGLAVWVGFRKLLAAPLRRRMLEREVSASLEAMRGILEHTSAESP